MTIRSLAAVACITGLCTAGCGFPRAKDADLGTGPDRSPRITELESQLDLARREVVVRDSRIDELRERSDQLSEEIRRLNILTGGQEGMIRTLRRAIPERDEYRDQVQKLQALMAQQNQRLAKAEAENKILRLRLGIQPGRTVAPKPAPEPVTKEDKTDLTVDPTDGEEF